MTVRRTTAAPWYRHRAGWIGATAVLVVAALVIAWVVHDPYPQQDMDQLTAVGQPVSIPGSADGARPDLTGPLIRDEVAYFGAMSDATTMQVTAIDLTTGSELWTTDPILGTDFDGLDGDASMLYLTDTVDDDVIVTFLDPDDGDPLGSVTLPRDDQRLPVDGTFVNVSTETGTVTGYDTDAELQWTVNADITVAGFGPELLWSLAEEPRGSTDAVFGSNLYLNDDEGTVVVIDTDAGTAIAEATVGTAGDVYQFYDGTIFVADDEAPTLSTFDATNELSSIDTVRRDSTGKVQALTVCGKTRVCVLTMTADNDPGPLTMVEVDSDGMTVVGSTPADLPISALDVTGETLAVMSLDESDPDNWSTTLLNEDLEPIGDPVPGMFWRIDSGSFLNIPVDHATTPAPTAFVGLGARDGTVYQLGSVDVVPDCDATDRFLVCPTESGYQVWKFRD